MIVVLLTVTGGGIYLATAIVARHRAQAAADLAALAAAAQLPAGAGSACTRAAAVARAMHTDTAGCLVDHLDVVVTIELPTGRWGTARAAARAGPT